MPLSALASTLLTHAVHARSDKQPQDRDQLAPAYARPW
jgi:hypothetical protein